MRAQFDRFFALPVFADEEQTRLASLMRRILLAYFGFALLVNSVLILFNFQSTARLIGNAVVSTVVCLGLWALARRGYVRFSAAALITVMSALFLSITILDGGLRAPVTQYYIVPILLAWLLLGRRAGIITSALLMLALLGVAFVEDPLRLLPPPLQPSSHWLWLLLAIAVITVTWVFYLATDSLERALQRARRVERELNEQIAQRQQLEDAYRLLVEHSLQGMCIVQDGRIVFANSALADALGYSLEELYALHDHFSLIHPDDRDWFTQRWRNRLAGLPEPSHYEIRALRKDGSPAVLELSVAQLVYRGRPSLQVTMNDVTERRRSEEALRLSEKRYRALVENLPGAAVMLYDRNLRYVLVDGPEIEATGFTREGMIGRAIYEVLPPDFYAIMEPHLKAALAGEPSAIEAPYGDRIYSLSYLPVRDDAAGEIAYGMILALNITEQARSREKLRESEEKFSRAFHDSPVAIAINHLDTFEYVDVNQSYLRLIGAEREQVIGSTPMALGVRIVHGDVTQRTNFVRRGGRGYRQENQLRVCSGAVRDVMLSVEGITIGGELCLLSVLEDITERNLAIEALRRSEERFRSMVENALVGIFMIDTDYRFDYVNDELAAILGYSRAELIGMDVRRVVDPAQVEMLTERHARRMRGEDAPSRYELHILCKDGSLRDAEISIALIHDPEGKQLIIGQLLDVTERKRLEQQRFELALAQERVDLLRIFIGNVSHDLKTPLASILMSLSLFERHTDPAKRREKIETVREQVEVLQHLIQNMLTISRLEYVPQLNRLPADINGIIRDIERQLRSPIEKKQLTVRLALADDLPMVSLDISEMQRALINLVENAINYTPEGGSVAVQTTLDAQSLMIEVSDSGIGIAEDDLPRIFERFYRSNEARAVVTSGSGLGLAIVKKVVEMHSGSIDVESRVGVGTTFRVWLPLANEPVL